MVLKHSILAILFCLNRSTNSFILKKKFMSNLLYAIAVILIIGWLVGFFVFNAGGVIHVLLVIAAIVILLRIIQGRRVV